MEKYKAENETLRRDMALGYVPVTRDQIDDAISGGVQLYRRRTE